MDFKKKILVVEGSEIQRAICVAQLKQAGFENVEVAGDGNVAYSKLEEGDVDLILCEWEMPELNGIQLLRKVKKNPTLQKIPFVMLTSVHDEDHYNEALSEGVEEYIIKPANPDLLKKTLENID